MLSCGQEDRLMRKTTRKALKTLKINVTCEQVCLFSFWATKKRMLIIWVGENPKDTDNSDEEETSSEISSEDEDHLRSDVESISGISDISIAPDNLGLMADAEFRTEVTQSLERAFAEGHSVDNAAVELKTLRMASNVPLIRVKEAVVAAIVEKIPMVDGDAVSQRKEIYRVIGRWGELINRIGGVDAVETISILQVTYLITSSVWSY